MIDHIDITATVARERQERLRADGAGRVLRRLDVRSRRPRNRWRR